MRTETQRYDFPWPGGPRSYCPKCGTRTVTKTRNARGFGRFGERHRDAAVTCPNKRRILDGHYRYGWARLEYIPPPPLLSDIE